MFDMNNAISLLAILCTFLIASSQWIGSIKRKASEGERIKELEKAKEDLRKEFDKELDVIKLELADFRGVKSKVDLIEARVGDIFTIMNKMSDNLDKYIEKIESNIEKKDVKYEKSFMDLYASKADK